jgi:hypothetical protein
MTKSLFNLIVVIYKVGENSGIEVMEWIKQPIYYLDRQWR